MNKPQLSAVILAGGQGRRMGGRDKGLVVWQQQPLIAHVIERVQPQVASLALSVNRNFPIYQRFGLPLLADAPQQQGCGPLAGIAAALRWAQTPYLLVTPCDTPRLPLDLAARLYTALSRSKAALAFAHDGERAHYSCALLHYSLASSLETALASGQRRLGGWYAQQAHLAVDFSAQAAAFINLNTAEDCRRWAETGGGHLRRL